MEKLLWEMFRKTGEIKYYLLAKRVEGENNGTAESRRNSNR